MTITPAIRILLESAQDTIDNLKKRCQELEAELKLYQTTVFRLRGEIKSLKMENEQKDEIIN